MWAKLDDSFSDHRKIFTAGIHLGRFGTARAIAIYIEGLCFSARNLTDGFLPLAVVTHFRHDAKPLEVARVLARDDVRLWHEGTDGFLIHDYEVYNPSSGDIKARRDWDQRRKQLYSTRGLVEAIRTRDQNSCRYCGKPVNWSDRRSALGGTYDHILPRGPNSLENVVVCCHRCNTRKGGRTPAEAGMTLLPIPSLEKDLIGTSSNQVPDHDDPVPVPVPVLGNRAESSAAVAARRVDLARDASPDGNLSVLIRVAHDVIDRDPDLAAMDDALCDAVKIRASKAQISYAPHVLTAAVEAAIRQRTPPQKAKTGKVSRAERAQAVQIRDRVHGRCPHDPHCLNYNACITTIVEERREQDRRVEHARRRRTA